MGRYFDPHSDYIEDESSVAPAVPGEEQDQYRDPKFAPVAKPRVFLGHRLEPGGKWKADRAIAFDPLGWQDLSKRRARSKILPRR